MSKNVPVRRGCFDAINLPSGPIRLCPRCLQSGWKYGHSLSAEDVSYVFFSMGHITPPLSLPLPNFSNYPSFCIIEQYRQRVGDSATERFTLRNRGKYEISFAFRVRRGLAASLFTVAPSKGVVESGKAVEVSVTFCSREEAHLKVRAKT